MTNRLGKRQSNDPRRRIAQQNSLSLEEQDILLRNSRYVGSAKHKRFPSNYRFHPQTNPRPNGSLCDDLRSISLEEAQRLFISGVRKCIVSICRDEIGLPKFVWAVDEKGEVYEAKTGNDGYHGYRLDEATEKNMRDVVLYEWKQR